MGDPQRKVRAAGAARATARDPARDDDQPGLMSEAHVAKARAPDDFVTAVTSVNVVADPGAGPRLYFTLDVGSKTAGIPGRFGQLMAGGAPIPHARFAIEHMSETECSGFIDLQEGAGAAVMSAFAKGTLEAVLRP
jgi:hypothetical protein